MLGKEHHESPDGHERKSKQLAFADRIFQQRNGNQRGRNWRKSTHNSQRLGRLAGFERLVVEKRRPQIAQPGREGQQCCLETGQLEAERNQKESENADCAEPEYVRNQVSSLRLF